MLSKNIRNSRILHQGIQTLRAAAARPFSTLLNAPDSKVLFESHSNDVFEFKLNNNKVLNSIDVEMVDTICT